MKAKSKTVGKQKRKRYNLEFKQQALARAAQDAVAVAARVLRSSAQLDSCAGS